MKRFQLAIILPLLVFGPYAYADSVPTFDITQSTGFINSEGYGTFTMTGPGTDISGSLNVTCQDSFCGGQLFPPGAVVSEEQGGFFGMMFVAPFTRATIGATTIIRRLSTHSFFLSPWVSFRLETSATTPLYRTHSMR